MPEICSRGLANSTKLHFGQGFGRLRRRTYRISDEPVLTRRKRLGGSACATPRHRGRGLR
jgi:hypothetical protein